MEKINFAEAQQTIDEAETDLMFFETTTPNEPPSCAVLRETCGPVYRKLLTLAKDLMPKFGQRATGRIRWYNETDGYGFVTGGNGRDAFVHKKSLHEAGIETLREGDKIEYTVVDSAKGLQARAIARIK